jgi:hypothetical protein
MKKGFWQWVSRTDSIVTIVGGLIVILGSIFVPEVREWIGARVTEFYETATHPVEVPLCVVVCVALWLVYRLLRGLVRFLLAGTEETIQEVYKGLLLTYVKDMNDEPVVRVVTCGRCGGLLRPKQEFPERTVIVQCENGHFIKRLDDSPGPGYASSSPDVLYQDYIRYIVASFTNNYRQRKLNNPSQE